MSAWSCRSIDGKADQKIVPPRLRIPYWKGLGADSEEKHEPASDIDTASMDGLKALDPKRPIREEADIGRQRGLTEVFEREFPFALRTLSRHQGSCRSGMASRDQI